MMGWLDSDYEGERLGQQIKLALNILFIAMVVFVGVLIVICFGEAIQSAFKIVFAVPLWARELMS
jgi:hypothetical protein